VRKKYGLINRYSLIHIQGYQLIYDYLLKTDYGIRIRGLRGVGVIGVRVGVFNVRIRMIFRLEMVDAPGNLIVVQATNIDLIIFRSINNGNSALAKGTLNSTVGCNSL